MLTIKDILARIRNLGSQSPESMTAEQKTAFEAELVSLQAELDALSPNRPSVPAVPGSDINAQLEQQLKPLRDMMGELAKTVTTMAEYTKTEQQKQLEAQKSATAKRYVDRVGELLKSGKVTKADHDDLIKPDGDKFKRNTASDDTVDLFVESTDRWATIPGFKPAPGEQKTLPQGGGSGQPVAVTPGSPEHFTQLREATKQEITDNMQS